MTGRVKSLKSVDLPDPPYTHSQSFFSSGSILKGRAERFGFSAPERVRVINKMATSENDRGFVEPEYLAFVSQPDLPGLPAAARTCLRCGVPIPAPKRAGRPERFCSERCRHDQAAEQRASWADQHDVNGPEEVLSCWTCGVAFPAPEARRGRLPRFCGPDCRRMHRREQAARYRARKGPLSSADATAKAPVRPTDGATT